MIHKRKTRIAARRADPVEQARRVLQEVVNGSLDAYEGYRRVRADYNDSPSIPFILKKRVA